ncbi:heterodimeric geranylgeranyl pyrophosphate synthase small subunit, chloroplastic-like [Cucurbita maxima]|uniref:Heterodimeric geranylgeranyl pyrophosphate synthase small subunit, chloroplastic-like n=1 Tax=Cucurbita maxima TaxID=3661 RepID=A0A6J1IK44_CUCMA|nr:heterodimeric geranylgeranyl pyrophosphate synthase small subunit, chloroplastic-like [Cucurbita maxima]
MAISLNLLQLHGNPSLPKFPNSNWLRPAVYFRAPMRATVVMSQITPSYWAAINEDIEEHLRRIIIAKDPPVVYEPLGHFVFSAPRNSAAAMCIAACEFVGGHRDQAMAAATALQLIYAATYTREYPPLTARGSSNAAMVDRVYAPNIQLLTGVGIAPIGFEILAGSCDLSESGSDRVRRVMGEMARAMGSEGWIGGQFKELEEVTAAAEAEEVIEKTEGELHARGGACGAILGSGSEEEIEKMRKYGRIVGMVKGLSKKVFGGKENERKREKIKELKALAFKELEGFKGEKVDQMCNFFDFEGL